jgi:hypothetical protein
MRFTVRVTPPRRRRLLFHLRVLRPCRRRGGLSRGECQSRPLRWMRPGPAPVRPEAPGVPADLRRISLLVARAATRPISRSGGRGATRPIGRATAPGTRLPQLTAGARPLCLAERRGFTAPDLFHALVPPSAARRSPGSGTLRNRHCPGPAAPWELPQRHRRAWSCPHPPSRAGEGWRAAASPRWRVVSSQEPWPAEPLLPRALPPPLPAPVSTEAAPDV